MSDIDNTAEIIDISPEDIIEGKVEEKTPPKLALSLPRKIALVTGLIVLSSAGGAWAYRDLLSSYLPSDQVQAMATRMDGLETTTKTFNGKVDAVIGFTDEIKSQLAAAQAAAAEIGQLQANSRDVKTSIANLEKALATASSSIESLNAQMAAGTPIANSPYAYGGGVGSVPYDDKALAKRLGILEKDVESLKQAGKAAIDTTLLSQSLADLKAKIAAGTSYQSEIDRIALMVPAAEGLDTLQAHSAQGLPNAVALAAELKTAAASLPKAEPVATPDDSWWGYSSALLSNLVTIKFAGEADWEQLALQVAALAEQGDLASAVANLIKPEGALPVELQRWHDRAAARLEIESAVEITSAAVLRQIAAKG